MQGISAIIKKLEKDKYIFVFQKKYLPQLQISKFSLLEEVRAVNIGNEMAVTISMGLGVNEVSYEKAYEYARAAIDLALGRGGDQAVVKEGERILYYGGKSVSVEKSTRVKARVKAHALKEFVEAKDKVVIMGHSIADIDSFGSGNILRIFVMSAPFLRKYAAASKVRTPVLVRKLFVSIIIPAYIASASTCFNRNPSPIYCKISATISQAEDAYGSI